jgi:hypothetical protein
MRLAFSPVPTVHPEELLGVRSRINRLQGSRARKALRTVAGKVSDFGEAAWNKMIDVVHGFRPVDIKVNVVPRRV